MIDVNERALELAKRNLVHNNITNANVFLSYAFQNVTKMYDLIVTNPPIRAGKKVVHEIFEGAFDHLNDKGELWVVIRKAQGAPSALEKIKTLFGKVNIVNRDKGYYIIQAIKNL